MLAQDQYHHNQDLINLDSVSKLMVYMNDIGLAISHDLCSTSLSEKVLTRTKKLKLGSLLKDNEF
jgi:hypothetical protein